MVFTKYDYLVVEHFRACNHISSLPDRKVEAINRAERAFNDFAKGLEVPFAPVSTLKEAQKDYGGLLIRSKPVCFLSKNSCYCRSDAGGFDQCDAGQSAGCRRFIVGRLGHCSAN